MTISGTEPAFYHGLDLANVPAAKLSTWKQATHKENSYTSYLKVAAAIEWKAGEYLAAIAYTFFAMVSGFCDWKYSTSRELGQSQVRKDVQTAFTNLMVMHKHKAFFNLKDPRINKIKGDKAAIEYQAATIAYREAIGRLRDVVQAEDLDNQTALDIIRAIRDQVLFLEDVDDPSDDAVPKFIVDGQMGALKVTSYLLKGVPYQKDCDSILRSQLPNQDEAIQRDYERELVEARARYERFASQPGVREVQSEYDGIFSSVAEIKRLFSIAYPDLPFDEGDEEDDDLHIGLCFSSGSETGLSSRAESLVLSDDQRVVFNVSPVGSPRGPDVGLGRVLRRASDDSDDRGAGLASLSTLRRWRAEFVNLRLVKPALLELGDN